MKSSELSILSLFLGALAEINADCSIRMYKDDDGEFCVEALNGDQESVFSVYNSESAEATIELAAERWVSSLTPQDSLSLLRKTLAK